MLPFPAMYLVPICNWTNEFSAEEVGLMVKFKKPSSFAIKFSATVYGVPKTPKLLRFRLCFLNIFTKIMNIQVVT